MVASETCFSWSVHLWMMGFSTANLYVFASLSSILPANFKAFLKHVTKFLECNTGLLFSFLMDGRTEKY